MGHWSYFPPYVPVGEKKAKAARKLAQLQKKNPDIQPVLIEGRAIAKTWWGRAWNQNLERYADYSNRIGRGRSYVRHGMVLDLKIQTGCVGALVQGTRSKPYKINIMISPLNGRTWKHVIHDCEGKLDSLPLLLKGDFPKELGEIFTAHGKGLFPTPKEINFSCSCPDWAYMCKHVAATLYGIGARLDQDPMLFFTLRKVDVNELVGRAVTQKTRSLLKKAKNKSGRVMEGADLGELFGIDLEDDMTYGALEENASKKTTAGKKPKPQPRQKKAVPRAKSPTSSPRKKLQSGTKPLTAIATLEGLIRKSKNGVTPATLAKKTGFDDKKVYNVLYRLNKLGRIKKCKNGKYQSVHSV